MSDHQKRKQLNETVWFNRPHEVPIRYRLAAQSRRPEPAQIQGTYNCIPRFELPTTPPAPPRKFSATTRVSSVQEVAPRHRVLRVHTHYQARTVQNIAHCCRYPRSAAPASPQMCLSVLHTPGPRIRSIAYKTNHAAQETVRSGLVPVFLPAPKSLSASADTGKTSAEAMVTQYALTALFPPV